MNKYLKIVNLVKRNSDEKVTSAIYGERIDNVLIKLILLLLLDDFLGTIILYGYGFVFFWIFQSIFLIFLIFYLTTRFVGIGITENRFVYIKVSRFFYKAKVIDDIPIEKIKNITVKKIGWIIYVKMTFINDIGKLKKVWFSFHTRVFGVGSFDYKMDSKKIYDRLKQIEKVLDKGDF